MRRIALRCLGNLQPDEADLYLRAASGDEVAAAYQLATDRNVLDGSTRAAPDDTEIHHALFLLRRARGLSAPSFDHFRVELRKRLAA
jgi:hypothetical protein